MAECPNTTGRPMPSSAHNSATSSAICSRVQVSAGGRPDRPWPRRSTKAVAELAARRRELNPGVPSVAGAAMHTQGLVSGSRQDLEQAVAILVTCPRPLALAAALEDLGCARLADGDRSGAVDAFDRVLLPPATPTGGSPTGCSFRPTP
jgi:Flp pilus assembly protein TadD